MEPIAAQLNEVTKLVDSGNFVPALDNVFPIERLDEAIGQSGKWKDQRQVVLDIDVKANKL